MEDRADVVRYFDLPRSDREEILARIGEAVATVPEVRLAYVFGSFVGPGRFRDLDIAFLSDRTGTWRTIGKVEGASRARTWPCRRGLSIPRRDRGPGRLRGLARGIVRGVGVHRLLRPR